jgi:hypothetical protein
VTEEEVSVALFVAADEDDHVDVLSWQSIDGKNYFAFDIKLRLLTGERMEPDLVLLTRVVWLIEVKGTHSEAISDEFKLVRLLDELGEQAVLEQISRRTGMTDFEQLDIEIAVAFGEDDLPGNRTSCEPAVHHVEWSKAHPKVSEQGLAQYLESLRAP